MAEQRYVLQCKIRPSIRPRLRNTFCGCNCSSLRSLFSDSFPKPANESDPVAYSGREIPTPPRQYLNESVLSEEHDLLPISRELLYTVRDVKTLNGELVKALDAIDSARVKSVLDLGANPNIQHLSRKETPLMSACYNGDHDSVRYLLNAQADPNMRTDDAAIVTALMIAAENGMTETVSELLRFNADPHVRNAAGETALLAAARTNNHDAFAVLVGSMVSNNVEPM